jgi:hypothetical protein
MAMMIVARLQEACRCRTINPPVDMWQVIGLDSRFQERRKKALHFHNVVASVLLWADADRGPWCLTAV